MTSSPLPLPAGGPADRDTVKGLLGIDDALEDDRVDTLVLAVNAVVQGLPYAQQARGELSWSPAITEGANRLVARLHARGRATFGAAGLPDVVEADQDIAMLLGLGPTWAKPAVG